MVGGAVVGEVVGEVVGAVAGGCVVAGPGVVVAGVLEPPPMLLRMLSNLLLG